MVLPSLHDNYLISYEVDCEKREIKLRARPPEWANNKETRVIIFKDVQGYSLENDAFGNIIASLEEVPINQVFTKYGAKILESFRIAGAPGPWAADLVLAPDTLTSQGVRAFVLLASLGLSGWILANEVEVLGR